GYAFCIWARLGWLQPLSMMPVIAGVVLLMGGWRLLGKLLAPILFLIFAMPPPQYRYRAIAQWLQQVVAAVAEPLLRMLPGIQIDRQGFQLVAYDVNGNKLAQFAVAGACSGMNSLLAFGAIGLAMAYLSRRPAWQRIVMILAIAPVALTCNIVRVLVTGTLMI